MTQRLNCENTGNQGRQRMSSVFAQGQDGTSISQTGTGLLLSFVSLQSLYFFQVFSICGGLCWYLLIPSAQVLRLSTRSHSKEVKNFACLRVPRYLLQGQDMVSFLLMINMTFMIMASGLNFSGRERNMLSSRYLQMMTCKRTERAGRCV